MDKSEIFDSLKDFSKNTSSELSGYQVIYSKLRNNLPQTFEGGFAVISHIRDSNRKDYALRIFKTPVDRIKERTEKISGFLTRNPSPYFLNYRLLNKGLKIAGQYEDVVLMDWIEGQSLSAFIDNAIEEGEDLTVFKDLAGKVLEMFKWMHEKKISHRDLQPDNIIIDEDLNVKLCDYDSVCIPELEGFSQITGGVPGYQHPYRIMHTDDPNVTCSCKDDYFSELVLYMGLLFLSVDSSVWNYHDDYSFIFDKDDFETIGAGRPCSKLDEVRKIANKSSLSSELNQLLDLLVENLKAKDLDSVKPMPYFAGEKCPICGTPLPPRARFCANPNCDYRPSKKISF